MNCLGVADPVARLARVVGVAVAEADNAVVRVGRVADPDNLVAGARPEAELVRLDAVDLADALARVNRADQAKLRADQAKLRADQGSPRADRARRDQAGVPVVHPIPMP